MTKELRDRQASLARLESMEQLVAPGIQAQLVSRDHAVSLAQLATLVERGRLDYEGLRERLAQLGSTERQAKRVLRVIAEILAQRATKELQETQVLRALQARLARGRQDRQVFRAVRPARQVRRGRRV